MKATKFDLFVFRVAMFAALGAMTGYGFFRCLEMIYEIIIILALRVHWIP